MRERSVPSFLLMNIHTLDNQKLVDNLRLSILWIYVNPNKPYDHGAAIKLRSQLRVERELQNQKNVVKQREEMTEARRNYLNLCRDIAELCFDFELSGASDQITSGVIKWTDAIKDLRTGKTISTPRKLLDGTDGVTVGWSAPNADAITETMKFLSQLRARLDGFEYFFSIPRPYAKPSGEESLFAEKPSEYVKFYIKLTWSPLSDKELVKRVQKIVSKSKLSKK